MTLADARQPPRSDAPPGAGRRRWLLFVHQLPARPTALRVRTWRRLQQIGAIAVKQAVYILPDSPNAREDFEWLKTEIEAGGGHASVFAADTVDTWSNEALVEEFRRSRQRPMVSSRAKPISSCGGSDLAGGSAARCRPVVPSSDSGSA